MDETAAVPMDDIDVFVEKRFLDARKLIESGEFSLVILPEKGRAIRRRGKGVRDLLQIFEKKPQTLKNAVVLDSIIGKAAASILILGGARVVYGRTISNHGRDFLDAHGVLSAYRVLVDRILNRTGDDFCPVEKASLPATNAEDALRLIKERIAVLMQKKAEDKPRVL